MTPEPVGEQPAGGTDPVHIQAVELRRVALPLVRPFRTFSGVVHERDALLIRVVGADVEGWGECVAMSEPMYTSEYVDGAAAMLRHHLLPRLLAGGDVRADAVTERLAPVKGHPMAKAAIEMAVLDADLRAAGQSFASRLGSVHDRVPAGVAIGIPDSIGALLDDVASYVDEGYRRVKLKIAPGWDVEPVAAVRERFGDTLALQVDANGAYTLDHADHLAQLDAFDLQLLEQPLAEDDLFGHADLANRVRTPICLDESITSARIAALAISVGACTVVNVKAGRVGGYLEAVRVHDVCRAAEIPVWCGGMLETGLGRAANVALAALPGFTLPGDTSASARYFATDLTPPFVLDEGHLAVPTGPGLGVEPVPDILRSCTTAAEWIGERRS